VDLGCPKFGLVCRCSRPLRTVHLGANAPRRRLNPSPVGAQKLGSTRPWRPSRSVTDSAPKWSHPGNTGLTPDAYCATQPTPRDIGAPIGSATSADHFAGCRDCFRRNIRPREASSMVSSNQRGSLDDDHFRNRRRNCRNCSCQDRWHAAAMATRLPSRQCRSEAPRPRKASTPQWKSRRLKSTVALPAAEGVLTWWE
jgi:hypothetical protein